MKTFAALLCLFIATTAFMPQPVQYVYIDSNPKAELYHSDKACTELQKKGHLKIIKVTLDDALHKYNRKPCPLCVKPVKS
jgi:hypothetical protein